MDKNREEMLERVEREAAETRAWKAALIWHPLVATDLSVASLEMALAQAETMGIKPVRLVVGPIDRQMVNRWGDRDEHLEVTDSQVLVSNADSFRIIREGSSSIVLEVVIGDFVDDGRWYIEDHEGKRLGSI
jgi:hypothetical protein